MFSAAGSKLFCYYSSSSQLRPDVGKFEPEDVDPGLCTHIIFAFVDLIKGTSLQPGSANDLANGKDPGCSVRHFLSSARVWARSRLRLGQGVENVNKWSLVRVISELIWSGLV